MIIGRETNLSTQLSSYSPYTIQDSILTKHTTFHIAGYTITGDLLKKRFCYKSMKSWTRAIDLTCDELCYNDLSKLIKSFI